MQVAIENNTKLELRDCPLCKAKGQKAGPLLTDLPMPYKKYFNIFECSKCSSEFLNPLPSRQILNHEYAGYFEKRAQNQKTSKQVYFEEFLTSLALDLNDKKILDVGAGEGFFSKAVLKLYPKAQVFALEDHPDSIKLFEDISCVHIHQSLEEWLSSASNIKFDYIFCLDLLEHIEDPIASVRSLVRLHMDKEAVLVASFPNCESLPRKILGRLWPQYLLQHLTYFSAQGVELMLQQSNLKKQVLRSHYKRLPLGYILSVASGFSPTPVKKMVQFITPLLPNFIKNQCLKLGLGEWLLIAKK